MDSRNALREKGAKDAADALRNLTAEEYKRQNKPGLNGFAFSKSSMETDVAGLEAEIEDIMSHPRKYRAVIMILAYLKNTQI